MNNPELPIHNMARRHRLSNPVLEGYVEAARVCLDRYHISPVVFQICNPGRTTQATVIWDMADELLRRTHANEHDAVRDGAYAFVLAAIELLCGLTAVSRADTGTGADYYICPSGASADDFEDIEDCLRLEVSGVGGGNATRVHQRLQEKLDQARKGKSNLPALAGVVGFRAQLICMEPA